MQILNQNADGITIDGLKITPKLIDKLKDLLDGPPQEAQHCIARSCLFICSIKSHDLDEIDKEFYALQNVFYDIIGSLEEEGSQK